MRIEINKNHKNIQEIVKGTSKRAICVTVIGKKFQSLFNKYCINYFKSYAKKYNLGLIIIKDLIIKKEKLYPPFNTHPNLQRLLLPKEIKRLFPTYKFLADIDADCIPTPIARNIFDYANFKNFKENKIYLVSPRPFNFSRGKIGKRLSLLRKEFFDKKFPLNSLLSCEDEDEKKIYNLRFDGPIATIGTCVGSVDKLIECFDEVIQSLLEKPDKLFYLQHYTNKIFRLRSKVLWLPYEFQAIWSYEVALNYPFLIKNINNQSLFNNCLKACMSKVDMLHFAGSWPENNVFKNNIFLKKNNSSNYYKKLPKIINKELKTKAYGRLRFLK